MKLTLKLTLKSLLSYGLILGNKIANIIYNMSDFNVTSTFFRTVNNAGSDGDVSDGDAYSGNFLSLNESGRINESVPLTTAAGKWAAYIDQSTRQHTKVSTPAITYDLTVSAQNFFGVNKEPTVDDLIYLDANPESIGNMVNGDLIPQLSFVLADLISWYPCDDKESGQFLQNVLVPLGVENITVLQNIFIEAGTGTGTPSGLDANIDLTALGTINFQPQLQYNIPSVLFVGASVISFILTVHSGTATILGYQIGTRNDIGLNKTYGVGVHEIKYLSLFNTSAGSISVYFDGTATTFNADVTNFSFKEVTASEIINFVLACRTDFENVNYGFLDHLFIKDASGRITGKTTLGDIICIPDGRDIKTKTRTRTADITIELTPNAISSVILVDTTIGDITMNVGGSVTASSGSVAIDTTTLQVGVKSIVTVTGISISGISSLFKGLDGIVHNYTEKEV